MNPDVKTKWINALKSGDYTQAKGYLQTTEGYCCLGVLCDLALKDGAIDAPEFSSYEGEPAHYAFDGMTGDLPFSVMEWAGLNSHDPVVPTIDGDTATLAILNDERGYNFNQIADVIEKEL